MHLNHPEAIPSPPLWKKCLPQNQPLVPRSLGTVAPDHPPVVRAADPPGGAPQLARPSSPAAKAPARSGHPLSHLLKGVGASEPTGNGCGSV